MKKVFVKADFSMNVYGLELGAITMGELKEKPESEEEILKIKKMIVSDTMISALEKLHAEAETIFQDAREGKDIEDMIGAMQKTMAFKQLHEKLKELTFNFDPSRKNECVDNLFTYAMNELKFKFVKFNIEEQEYTEEDKRFDDLLGPDFGKEICS